MMEPPYMLPSGSRRSSTRSRNHQPCGCTCTRDAGKNVALVTALLAVLGLLAVVLILGLSRQKNKSNGIQTEISSLLQEMWDKINKDQYMDLVQMYSEDCAVLPPGQETLKGRTAVLDYFMHSPEGTRLRVLISMVVEVEQLGADFVLSSSQFEAMVNGSSAGNMKSVTIWKRVGIEWLVYRYIYNTNQ